MYDLSKDFTVTVSIQTPMGPVKVLASILWQDPSHFSGEARLMGFSNHYEGGVRTDDHFAFDIAVKVPFGTLNIHVDAVIDPEGGIIGEATMPHRKPMHISGHVDS